MPQKDIAELANVAILEIEDACISGDSQIGHDAVHTNASKRCRRACKRSHSWNRGWVLPGLQNNNPMPNGCQSNIRNDKNTTNMMGTAKFFLIGTIASLTLRLLSDNGCQVFTAMLSLRFRNASWLWDLFCKVVHFTLRCFGIGTSVKRMALHYVVGTGWLFVAALFLQLAWASSSLHLGLWVRVLR